eukprot:12085523-Prorocentrum_lima.AAC.1
MVAEKGSPTVKYHATTHIGIWEIGDACFNLGILHPHNGRPPSSSMANVAELALLLAAQHAL